MIGLDHKNGAEIHAMDHLQQSIQIILTTPIGSRVMRRNFGSLLPSLIDAPYNTTTRVRVYAAIAKALVMWEPRIKLRRVSMEFDAPNHRHIINISGTLQNGQPITTSVNTGVA